MVYTWYVDRTGYENTFIYEIAKIEVSSDLLAEFNLDGGARGRVTAMALELELQSSMRSTNIMCVADSDLDFVVVTGPSCDYLLYTDYTCLEMYTCNKPTWHKAIGLGFGFTEEIVDKILENMLPIWHDIFLVRAAYTIYGWKWCFASVVEYCKLRGDAVSLNTDKFIERSLRDADHISDWSVFLQTIDELRRRTIDDPRKMIHKDDYLELIGWFLQRKRKWTGNVPGGSAIWSNLKTALDIDDLKQEDMFAKIDEFIIDGRQSVAPKR